MNIKTLLEEFDKEFVVRWLSVKTYKEALPTWGESPDKVLSWLESHVEKMVAEAVGENENFGPVEEIHMTNGDVKKETRNQLRKEILTKLGIKSGSLT
jgi:hypothetical protein